MACWLIHAFIYDSIKKCKVQVAIPKLGKIM